MLIKIKILYYHLLFIIINICKKIKPFIYTCFLNKKITKLFLKKNKELIFLLENLKKLGFFKFDYYKVNNIINIDLCFN